MPYVITQSCCSDASCVAACPVNCIHPAPQEPEFGRVEMLYIEPDVCIDCGACVDECPVNAIYPDDALPKGMERYLEINEAYYRKHPLEPGWLPYTPEAQVRADRGTLRVAIVGSGPAALYAAGELAHRGKVEVEMFDRLPTPFGLMRSGVAPDHPDTKAVIDVFRWTMNKPGFRFHGNVEVGKHLSPEELLAHHHAVIYAVGAASDRRLGIPGEDLPGSHAATEFVAWYNGHPDYADRTFDLTGPRAVVVGNGNVALDVARILVSDPETLARTDIADHALHALRRSTINEVVLLGRRGVAQAAYTTPEFLALGELRGVDIVIDPEQVKLDPASAAQIAAGEATEQIKLQLAREFAARPPRPGNKRIVFRYLASPVEIRGEGRAEQVVVAHNELVEGASGALVAQPAGDTETWDTSLVLRSIGYRGLPVPGVPFEHRRGVIPNERGRVLDESGQVLAGVYVTGWIKRGPSGVIGTNKKCAQETVGCLVSDFNEGVLSDHTVADHTALDRLLAERQPDAVDQQGWKAIDAQERQAGAAAGRPRVKTVDRDALLEIARRAQ